MIKVEGEVGGRTLVLETGRIAKQADGAVMTYYGECVVLGTVVRAEPRAGIDFFPLTVDYREKAYAAGKFPGGFFKREGRPTSKEILTMRMIDRPIRPLFPEGFMDEIQIQSVVLAADPTFDADITAVNASSAAVAIGSAPSRAPLRLSASDALKAGSFSTQPMKKWRLPISTSSWPATRTAST